MTRDDIIETALQCGVWIPMAQGQEREQTIDRLQRFVGRVVAAELEACAKGCETSVAGLRSETEWADGYIQATKDIAEGIRARGES
ncbi:MAG: hypothetical protein QG672_1300 [Pseudomonadota bacterium]|nr:hypothetical protein [Pseudomonadota bacterium]MDQ5907158.1 hypothetical protein [Pseudomonadota bacterium]